MLIHFSQIYIEPGVCFPFSFHFQRRLSDEVTTLIQPSARFIETYGQDFELMFRISAKEVLSDIEIRGPSVFRKTKDVEYTIFLPFTVIMGHIDAPRLSLAWLFKGVRDVFDQLEIDTAKFIAQQHTIIEGICADPVMLEAPSWDEEMNKTEVRKIFSDLFESRSGT